MSFPVLLVDDDSTVTNALNRALGLQFDLTICNSGQAALQEISTGPRFPVIVTDLRMPLMDGIEFIAAARKHLPTSKFIVLTGNHDVGASDYISQAGTVHQTVQKPAKKSELVDVIESAYRSIKPTE